MTGGEYYGLKLLTIRELRRLSVGYGSREYSGGSLSLQEQASHSRRAEAAREVLKWREEKRRQEIASDQLKGLMAGPQSSYDSIGLAGRAVDLADALIDALDAEG